MPTREEAVNTAIALALAENFGLITDPEKISRGGKSCDITVREKDGDNHFTAVECKQGQRATNQRDAVNNAKRWLKDPACWNAVAVCYPKELKTASSSELTKNKLATRNDYLMAQVSKNGVQGKWIDGKLSDLAELIKDVEDRDILFVVQELKQAIDDAAALITNKTTKELAAELQVLYEPKNSADDRRPTLIACLLIDQHNVCCTPVYKKKNAVPNLTKLVLHYKTLPRCLHCRTYTTTGWQFAPWIIAPVIDPAISILKTLPNQQRTTRRLTLTR